MRHIIKYGTAIWVIVFLVIITISYYNSLVAFREGLLSADVLLKHKVIAGTIIIISGLITGFILDKYHIKLYELSIKDPLTGLFNRHFLNILLDTELNRRIKNRKTTILMIDIDCFKQYNDIYGHIKGDDCLKKVANCLKTSARRSTDIVIRFGGEEFLILLLDSNVTIGKGTARNIHQRINELQIIHTKSKTGLLTLSIGIMEVKSCRWCKRCNVCKNRPETIVNHADEALYVAKETGRNKTVVYNEIVGDYNDV